MSSGKSRCEMRIAIQPDDDAIIRGEPNNASSPRWAELARAAGHQVHTVDVFRPDTLRQLTGCHGFMWRHTHSSAHRAVAARLLPVLEYQLGLCVYPNQNTCRHYDDKIAQWYLLEAAGLPIPETWVYWRRSDALEFCRTARYPLVLKLWAGAGSTNVRRIDSSAEAEAWIERLFGIGVQSLDPPSTWQACRKALRARLRAIARPGAPPPPPNPWEFWELHRNYVLLQEFLPDNPFDTRVTVIGNRAFGFRRFNREGDFRASGSGRIDPDPSAIDERFVRLAFRTARAIASQSCAIDGLLRHGQPVVTEISYAYASWAVHDCPGHWCLQGNPDQGELIWRAGAMWPEEAQIADFLARLEGRPCAAS